MNDTDRDWEELSRQDPYWAVLSNAEYRGLGESREGLGRFFETGRRHVTEICQRFERHFGRDPEGAATAVDFGCGVGRLLLPMAARARFAIGVDVSQTMRATCRERAAAEGVRNVDICADLETLHRRGVKADWINSYIVFQHIPTMRGYQLLDSLLELTAPACLCSIHVTLYKDARLMHYATSGTRFFQSSDTGTRSVLREERARNTPEMQMNDYDLTRVHALFLRHGFGELVMVHEDQAGIHGVMIYAAK
ncbi:MAG TPA: class I SAM-dependent methyltransferase [Rhizobiaceae bacterium]|nr:class I SAM-dependent methyltransferase [Rhizobiaceae bacterium]